MQKGLIKTEMERIIGQKGLIKAEKRKNYWNGKRFNTF